MCANSTSMINQNKSIGMIFCRNSVQSCIELTTVYRVDNCVLSPSVMSDSLQHHGLQPARLIYPWKASGKNSGVGSYFLLQGIFWTKGSNPGLLPHRQVLYHLSYQKVEEIPFLTRQFMKCLTKTLFPTENIHNWLIWVRSFSKSNFRSGFQMAAIRHKLQCVLFSDLKIFSKFIFG